MEFNDLRVKVIQQLHENPDLHESTWVELEEHFNIPPVSRAGDRLRGWYQWFKNTGISIREWAPGESMDPTAGDFLTEASTDVTGTKEWQEFLAWKKTNREKKDFTPGTHVVLGCTHIPFHNRPFFESVLKLISDLKPQGLHLIGDFMDLNSLSAYDKGRISLEGVTLGWEYKEGNTALDQLDQALDGKTLVKNYLYGNHEDRYFRHMSKVDNSKYGDALPSPTKALKLEERGYDVYENWKEDTIYLGKFLEANHGEYCNIHSAKKHIDVFRTSILYAHTHRVQSYIEGNVGGYNIGWGGDINSSAFSYASKGQKSRWNNGFAVVDIDEEGYYFVNQIIWENNKFFYGSKKY